MDGYRRGTLRSKMVLSIDQWVGKLAVVTGASAGIGAALTKKLVESGINVVGLARRVEKVQDIANNLIDPKAKLYAFKCDITDEEDVKRVFDEIRKIGPIHILVNNAGTMAHTTLYNGTVADWRKVLDTNVMGTCIVSKEAIKAMTTHKIAGQIININSILGHYVYNIPNSNIYTASKHALTALTETLRLELIGIDSKIKVTSLSPGPVDDTEFFVKSNIGADGEGPIKHFLKPDDVVNGVLYVLSTPPHLQVAGLAKNNTAGSAGEEMANILKGKLYPFQCDVTDEVQVIETFAKIEELLGPVNILVNNAGVLYDGNLLDGNVGDWKTTFDTNVLSKCITNQITIKQMQKHKIDGQIININSVLGHHVYDIPNMNVYPATQYAITALSETLRLELIRGGSRIKITNLSPGPVDTKMFDKNTTMKSKISKFLKPDDVADAVIYILSTPMHVQVQELIIRPVGEAH